jgi:hypothetical protein
MIQMPKYLQLEVLCVTVSQRTSSCKYFGIWILNILVNFYRKNFGYDPRITCEDSPSEQPTIGVKKDENTTLSWSKTVVVEVASQTQEEPISQKELEPPSQVPGGVPVKQGRRSVVVS